MNALLASGIKQKDIAAQFPGLSAYALSRHKRNCLAVAPPATNGNGDSLQVQLALWLQRSEDLYHAGGATLDLRSQGQAISSAFRALEFRFKHEERLQEQIVRDLPRDTRTWTDDEGAKMRAYLDSVVASAAETPYASVEARLFGIEGALTKRTDGLELVRLFERVLKDNTLLDAVRALTKEAA